MTSDAWRGHCILWLSSLRQKSFQVGSCPASHRLVNHDIPTPISDLIPKVGQICQKWGKSGTFSDQISVHFGIWVQRGTDWPQMGQIRDFFRSNLSTFWANLPLLGPKSGLLAYRHTRHVISKYRSKVSPAVIRSYFVCNTVIMYALGLEYLKKKSFWKTCPAQIRRIYIYL